MRNKSLLLSTAASALFLTLPPAPAAADDRSYLTAFLEDNLSGAGRKVTITGFAGALSSRATIQQLTIADDQGIWITLDDVALDWSRTALLSGQVIINELSAGAIRLERMPEGEADTTTPEASSFDFALPELPVSLDIGVLKADKIALGEAVLGQRVEGQLNSEVHLNAGEGTAALVLQRTDSGPEGEITLNASYSNATRQLVLDLTAREGAGGIIAGALDLPGAPAASLSLKGEGSFDDFAADFRLASDGSERLSGPITVRTDAEGGRAFTAALAGNPAPLFLPDYAEFLGERLSLDLAGALAPSGAVEIERLSLEARALDLQGRLRLAPDGLPELIDLQAKIVDPNGAKVVLPISGPDPMRIRGADLSLVFDAAAGDGWQLALTASDYERAESRVAKLALQGAGVIGRQAGSPGLDGRLKFDLSGLAGLDPELQAALGEAFTGEAQFLWRAGETGGLQLPEIRLSGADYGLQGAARISGIGEDLNTALQLEVDASDLARFSGLAGRPLTGGAKVKLSGDVSPLTGAFDLVLDLAGRGLSLGIAEADRLLAGGSQITASLLRDTTGTTLRSFSAKAASLAVTGSGKLQSEGLSLTAEIDWANLADLGPGYGGALKVTGGFEGNSENGLASFTGWGERLRSGQPELDRLISGRSDLALSLALKDGVPLLQGLNLTSPNLTAEVKGEGDSGAMVVSGRLSDLALLAPDFPGAVTLSGNLTPEGEGLRSDLRLQGPGGIEARITGLAAARPDLTISGTGQAAVVNGLTVPVTLDGGLGYDIRLSGGWGAENASGRLTLTGGQIAIPARGLSLENVAATADLEGGRARVEARGEALRGGRFALSGGIGLAAPFNGDLSLELRRLVLRDPELFETLVDAQLSLNGPLLGAAQLRGRVQLDETELRVPSTGFASAADLEAVRHSGDSAEVRATRTRAGVGSESGTGGEAGASAGSGGLPPWGLDVTISAPNQVFVRGRGLDAELSGDLRLTGSLNAIVPAGGLELVRGRLDILGQRLVLDRASLVMEGSFMPYITFVASNVSDEVQSIVTIEGPANNPVVTFSSDPDLPQEEVLAWLLFGRGLDTISAFQALQLANAVATLAGRGGEGIVGRLRQGTGFDDLDVSTAADGTTSVNAGKYIAKNVYTELGVDQEGNTRVNLNLDLRPGVTVKGRVDSDGSSGIGLFLERDY